MKNLFTVISFVVLFGTFCCKSLYNDYYEDYETSIPEERVSRGVKHITKICITEKIMCEEIYETTNLRPEFEDRTLIFASASEQSITCKRCFARNGNFEVSNENLKKNITFFVNYGYNKCYEPRIYTVNAGCKRCRDNTFYNY